MIRRLNHAVLYVRDAAASTAFYTEVLGFTVAASDAPRLTRWPPRCGSPAALRWRLRRPPVRRRIVTG